MVDYLWQNKYDAQVQWDSKIDSYPVADMLQNTVEKFGDRPAIDFLGYKLNWQDVGDQVEKLAIALQASGIGKGDNIGLFLPNCPYFLVAYFAVLKVGATVVNINPLYAPQEVSHLIEDAKIKSVFTLDLALTYDKIQPMLAATCLEQVIVCPFTAVLPFPKAQLFPLLKRKDLAKVRYNRRVIHLEQFLVQSEKHIWSDVEIDPAQDVALLQYTGGTTGKPKGAMLTHANVVANVQQCRLWFHGIKDGEQKMLAVIPFFHVFAMTTVMNLSVYCGLEIIALPRFDVKDTLKTIEKKKPHLFPAVPAIYNAINSFDQLDAYDISSLEYCIAGGAPLPVEVKKNFETKTGCILVEGYGLTESSPVVCANPMLGENVSGSIGLPLPGTIVEIRDPDDFKTLRPQGERGELCVRGPQVMKGYWEKSDATAETIVDGTLRTGDIATIDENGYVYIVDRLKDMVITNGYNVYPRNIEEAIYQHPAVEECIVAGLPDKARGEIVKAWIKLKSDRELSKADLLSFLKDKLSPMERPGKIEFRDEPLPKTLIGKLSRKDIVEQELAKENS